MRRVPVILLLLAIRAHAQESAPIIDMHLHAFRSDAQGPPPLGLCAPPDGYPALDARVAWSDVFMEWLKNPPCKAPIWSPETDDDLMKQTLAVLERRNIIGVTSGPREIVRRWAEAAPGRIIPGLMFRATSAAPSPDELRRWFEQGDFKVLGEVTNQYAGIAPGDPVFEPYLALAEELDIPVGIHIGTGPPGAPYLGSPKYQAALHSPLLLEDVVTRHPKLRVYIMHAAWPMIDELLALLWTHPHVYVDTGVIDFVLPRAEFHRYLQRIVEAGFGKRIMFGSDQMVWPGAIEVAIESIESASFLSEQQKRDILFENALRFLRLSQEEVESLGPR